MLDILHGHYNRMVTLLVSQFPIAAWHDRIPKPTLADAILDWLVRNAHRIRLQGELLQKFVISAPCLPLDVQFVAQFCFVKRMVDFFGITS